MNGHNIGHFDGHFKGIGFLSAGFLLIIVGIWVFKQWTSTEFSSIEKS
jgi:hypothetical protein